MKLNTAAMRYLSSDDFRVLTATEMGSRNHEVVPTVLIAQIAALRGGSGVHNCISELAKANLIARVKNAKYDGYRLTYGGYDFLAIRAFANRGSVYAVGRQIGVGKESDIHIVVGGDAAASSTKSTGDTPKAPPKAASTSKRVLKIHRLGRTSFRSIKTNRDYLRNKHASSWMYMSRLSATKEYAFMRALYNAGFPVPEPIDHSRHCIVMSLVPGFPMRQLTSHKKPSALYSALMSFIVRLANHGIIHCDFNEFNIMILDTDNKIAIRRHHDESDATSDVRSSDTQEESTPFVVIDFPQCVSVDHADAERYFARDVDCIRRFFAKRLNYVAADYPDFHRDVSRVAALDVDVQASGFSKAMLKDFEAVLAQQRERGIDHQVRSDSEVDDEDEDGDDEEDDEDEGEEEDNDNDDVDHLRPLR
ncbi:Rio2, N-terminal-domain-containing protein [Limtongia smithiae]|uniref:Rio2, N-terminal-domain-containing protein n=1 Tax=Limtongia smithiae TaxID=1125753 RepID=UPI0034CD67E6